MIGVGAGVFTGPAWDELTDGHWLPFVPPSIELQRNDKGDTYGCESFALNSAHRFIWKCRYSEDFNKDDRFLVVGSGTTPSVGNSTGDVAEWDRVNGWIYETDWPFPQGMTITDYYNGGKVPPELLAKGLQNKKTTDVGYKWAKDESITVRLNCLKFSPVRTSVESYQFNNQGRVINSGAGYTHEIVIFDFVQGVEWWVYDSENNQFVKFDWNYQFDSSMIHNIKKKNMPKLFKLNSSPAIYFKHWSQDLLIPFGDGVLTGGDLFKSLYGVSDYSQLVIQHVDKLPFPVANYKETTI